jgi:hypothetical protein
MVYTSYEMIRDCRVNKSDGWSYFISEYLPVVRKLLAHYSPESSAESMLATLCKPESSLFQSLDPAPERWFVAELRQKVLAELPLRIPEVQIDLDAVASALDPLTVLEKQVAWLDSMLYGTAETGVMLRMTAGTAEKIRARALEMIRSQGNAWRPSLLSDNGLALGRTATAASGKDCLPMKAFIDILDGRTTWDAREQMERHVTACWHCIDHFCRMVEVTHLMRGLQPLADAEAEPYRKMLGLTSQQPAWKRLFGR